MRNRYSDEQLILQLASSDTREVDKAVKQLHGQYKDMIVRLVHQNSGTLQDGEELFDDALLGLWQAVQAGRYQPTARIKTYLYQIARNLWLNRIRAASRAVRFTDTESLDDYHLMSLDEPLEHNEAVDAFWEKVRAVGETCYNVLRAYADGYSMQEIAVRFELGTANNAKTIKYNCLKKVGKPLS
ncbi:RNA polymerase sigma factor [Fibrella forsythiae]|uniref:Sigma-70 family RNA polymerase sigma factor n=1 Tax=Fibrella forsythiae TaxID=2817061 RepID=A0ABS3JLM9_9BACT|nr:sigma-70 family RNA polymerase sigma factor [Fibrella forsythiae]MBO0950916.1 sigma-70 family RNA polymerase sigma factor [Fibrella forsythiae]